MAIARNHTATHLLQKALREVLGDHVHQAGSYQDASITHFDFTHFSAVTPEDLIRVQKIVNDKIFESMNVTVKEMPIEEAKKLGAMALFGEKYGKVVRVVDIEGWSTEFCGGTHVKNTAQIGGFKIVSESSVAAGIRRIEAVTGRNLMIRANMQEAMLHTVANTLKANNVAALPARAEAVMAENKAMSKGWRTSRQRSLLPRSPACSTMLRPSATSRSLPLTSPVPPATPCAVCATPSVTMPRLLLWLFWWASLTTRSPWLLP